MSTPTELERAKKQRLAAEREALAKALRDRFGPLSDLEWEEQPEDVRDDWRDDAAAILSTGILQDVAEVRREVVREMQDTMYAESLTELRSQLRGLRARVQALCEQITAYRDDEAKFATPHLQQIHHRALTWALSSVRALLADDGAAALREHDDRIRRDYAETIARKVERLPEGWPMEHHCFKPTCPDCRKRKRIERERQRAGRVIRDTADKGATDA